MNKNKPIILCIIDGFGLATFSKTNAISPLTAPTILSLFEKYPFAKLKASSEAVGLPKNTAGNSEVGHLNIGAGRAVLQTLPKINKSIETNELGKFKSIIEIEKELKKTNGTLHIFGLFSSGNVHSNLNHELYLIKLFASNNIKIKLHLISDGRDVAVNQFEKDFKKLQKFLKVENLTTVEIATLSGRYYAMDRNKNWDRTDLYLKTFIKASPKLSSDLPSSFPRRRESSCRNSLFQSYVKDSYSKNITDEFILPVASNDYTGISPNDILLCTNFRADRMRQFIERIIEKKIFKKIYSFISYQKEFDSAVKPIFKTEEIKNTLSEVLSKNNLTQLHIAETEKYAHVTFFFNAEIETPYKGEARILIPSPDVSTYDLKPQMSAEIITKKVVENFNNFDFILINYANPDMVGHTGLIEPTMEAIKSVDNQIKILSDVVLKNNAILIITADHGNAENLAGDGATTHSTSPVPFCIVSNNAYKLATTGSLADIAPTVLKLFDIKQPIVMTGKNLIKD